MQNQFKTVLNMKKNHLADKFPNFPKNYINPSYGKKSKANALTTAIKDFLNLSGHVAERISSSGRYIESKNEQGHKTGKGQWIPPTTTKGTADISATIKGKSVKIEVKIGKDKQSDYQKEYESNIIKAGGFYWIAKDFDGFFSQYTDFINSLT